MQPNRPPAIGMGMSGMAHLTEQRRPAEQAEMRGSVDAWLRQALAEHYGAVLEEELPPALVDLLPPK